MKTHKHLTQLALAAALYLTVSLSATAASFRVNTRVVDHVMDTWTLECPDGRTIDLMNADIAADGLEMLMECLARFESENGVQIRSRTTVRNGVVDSDVIRSTTTLNEEQASKLCQIVDSNPTPGAAATQRRPTVQCVAENGQIVSWIVTFPDGRILDLTELEGDLLADVIALIEQFEEENGVEVTGTSRTVGGRIDLDRTLSLSYLTLAQAQQLHALLLANQWFILPDLAVYPVDARLRLSLGRGSQNIHLHGDVVVQRQPTLLPNANNEPAMVPTELIQMDLRGEHPQLGIVDLQLDPLQPTLGVILAPQPDGPGEVRIDGHVRIRVNSLANIGHRAPIQWHGEVDDASSWIVAPTLRLNQDGITLFDADGMPIRAKLSLSLESAPKAILSPVPNQR